MWIAYKLPKSDNKTQMKWLEFIDLYFVGGWLFDFISKKLQALKFLNASLDMGNPLAVIKSKQTYCNSNVKWINPSDPQQEEVTRWAWGREYSEL